MVIANGSDKAEIHSDSLLDYVPMGELEAPDASRHPGPDPGPGRGAAEDASMTLLQGELIDDDGMKLLTTTATDGQLHEPL